jgi:exodeoxyribonuclease VII large subunit
MQGPEAVSGVVGGIESLNLADSVDVIIVARGGGSLEELWAFNSEDVARAIFGSTIPVVSAIGHETDVTIADYVADRRAPTPSVAAEIVAPDRVEMKARVGVATGTMEAIMATRLALERRALEQQLHEMERRIPDTRTIGQRVDELVRRSAGAVERTQRDVAHNVGSCVWRLKSLDPFATLERGYAIILKRGRVVTTVGAVHAGEPLDIRVRDGTFGATVGNAALPQRRRTKRVPDAQAPLFAMPEERA